VGDRVIKKINSNNKFIFVINNPKGIHYFQKISAKNILHLYDISGTEINGRPLAHGD
jgi:DNA helicase HerA-like ATPase